MTMPASQEVVSPGDFMGKPAPADRVFFAAPPAEIGALVAAESNLKAGKKPMNPTLRLAVMLLSLLPGIYLIYNGMNVARVRADDGMPLIIFGVVVALLGFLIAWAATRFKAICAYVGETGAVRYTLKGKLDGLPKREFIDFRSAANMRTSQTRHYYNGAYTGTSYSFIWTDPAGKKLLTLRGRYSSQKGTPKASSPYHFARVAEFAWSNFLLTRADAELAETGALKFTLDAKRTVIVGPGYIEFHFNGRTDRCEAGDIKSINLEGGTFSIKHRDAKWYSSKGKFSFPYGQMANARLFTMTLDRFLPSSTWHKE